MCFLYLHVLIYDLLLGKQISRAITSISSAFKFFTDRTKLITGRFDHVENIFIVERVLSVSNLFMARKEKK
jgi:hypothetical protein